MDPDASPELQRDALITIHELCQSFTLADAKVKHTVSNYTHIFRLIIAHVPSQEQALCNRLIKFASSLTAANKSHLISFIAGGSGPLRRIARWVAHAIIVNAETVDQVGFSRHSTTCLFTAL